MTETNKQSAAETLLAYKKAAWSLLVSKGGVRGPQKNEYWEEDVDYYGCTVATHQKETLEALALIQTDGVDWNATTDPANHMGHPSGYALVDQVSPEAEATSALKPVWRDGNFIKEFSLEELRANVRK